MRVGRDKRGLFRSRPTIRVIRIEVPPPYGYPVVSERFTEQVCPHEVGFFVQDEPLKMCNIRQKPDFHKLDVAERSPSNGRGGRIDRVSLPIYTTYQKVKCGDDMQAFRQFFKHIYHRDKLIRMKSLKTGRILTCKRCIVGNSYAYAKTLVQDILNGVLIRSPLGNKGDECMMQTLGVKPTLNTI